MTTPISLLRELMHVNPELDDYALVRIFYEEYVRMSCELAARERAERKDDDHV